MDISIIKDIMERTVSNSLRDKADICRIKDTTDITVIKSVMNNTTVNKTFMDISDICRQGDHGHHNY